MNKPNILFAIADDASHFGIYGHDFVKTPNIDRVANDGILFENAFTSNPKCAPSRATILTGKYTWELEDACTHNTIFPKGYDLFPDILEENGYHVGFTGKGWGPGNYKRNGYTRNPAGTEYNHHSLTPPEDSAIRPCDYTRNFEDFLSKRQEGQPFYFWYGAFEPHRKYNFGEGLRGGKKIADMTHIPSYLPQEDEVKIDFLDYAYEIEWFDHHLGRMLQILEEHGELDNTVIIVTSDNGCPFPRIKGQMYEQDFHLPMVACYKNASPGGRTISDIINFADIAPTLLELAGIEKNDAMTGNSFADILFSTKNGQLKQSRNVTYFGKERHDVAREDDLGYPVRCIRTKQYLYIKNYAPDRWPAGNPETGYTNVDPSPTKRLILDQHKNNNDYYYKLCFGKRPSEELYDIVEDNECMHNLANDNAYCNIKDELSNRLEKFLLKTKDPRICIDENYFEHREYVGETRTWKQYVDDLKNSH